MRWHRRAVWSRLRIDFEPQARVNLMDLRQLLRIGIQWNTQVTLNDAKHTVSQAYCSALPVAYSHHPSICGRHSHGSF